MIKNENRQRFITICVSLCICACLLVGIISLCGLNVNAEYVIGDKWIMNNTVLSAFPLNNFAVTMYNITCDYNNTTFSAYNVRCCAVTSDNFYIVCEPSNNKRLVYANNAFVNGTTYNGWCIQNCDSGYILGTATNVIFEYANGNIITEVVWLNSNGALYIPITVTYNTNGGTLENGFVNPITVTNGMLPSLLPDVTKQGYTFLGWFFDSEYTIPALPNYAINGSVTLYAKLFPNGDTIVGDIVNIMTSGITSFGTNISSGINSMISGIALDNGSLSVFLVLVCCFCGVALCIGLSKFVVNWLQGFGR